LWISLLAFTVVFSGFLALFLMSPLHQRAVDVRHMTALGLITSFLLARLPFLLTLLVSLWNLLPYTLNRTPKVT